MQRLLSRWLTVQPSMLATQMDVEPAEQRKIQRVKLEGCEQKASPTGGHSCLQCFPDKRVAQTQPQRQAVTPTENHSVASAHAAVLDVCMEPKVLADFGCHGC